MSIEEMSVEELAEFRKELTEKFNDIETDYWLANNSIYRKSLELIDELIETKRTPIE